MSSSPNPALLKQIQDAIHAARPGLVRVYVLAAEYADGSHSAKLISAPTPPDDTVGEIELAADEDGAREPADLPARQPGESLVSYVQRLRRECGQIELKLRRWSPLIGISVAELERATALPSPDRPLLKWQPKEGGRDHGAKLVSAEAMAAYLVTADAIARGAAAPPPCWHSVRAGQRKAA